MRAAHAVGLQVEEQAQPRALRRPRRPRAASCCSSPRRARSPSRSQSVRIVLSLGARAAARARADGPARRGPRRSLSRESLELGAVSWYRDPRRAGIVAQDPEAETPAGPGRGRAGADQPRRSRRALRHAGLRRPGRASSMRAGSRSYGFRVGSARYEAYEGVAANTILKQFPPAGLPALQPRGRLPDGFAPGRGRRSRARHEGPHRPVAALGGLRPPGGRAGRWPRRAERTSSTWTSWTATSCPNLTIGPPVVQALRKADAPAARRPPHDREPGGDAAGVPRGGRRLDLRPRRIDAPPAALPGHDPPRRGQGGRGRQSRHAGR